MAKRSLTEIYILLRNNAVQARHIHNEQLADDRMALVHNDIEKSTSNSTRLPPEWVDGVEEVQYEISRIHERLKELQALHDKHVNRPTMDDSVDEEHAIQATAQEISQMFQRCDRLVHHVNARNKSTTSQEQRVNQNVMVALATSLLDLTNQFRKNQSTYLKKLQTREERSKNYFEEHVVPYEDEAIPDDMYSQGFSLAQMQQVEDNAKFVQEREQEIAQILKSISDMNTLFKDLGQLVVDQGSVLDRIDYNIEQTCTRVDAGFKQLQKASHYQKASRKTYCCMLLFVTCLVLLLVLIAVKA